MTLAGTLNPDLLAGDFAAALNDAAALQQEYRQSVLMPEHVLLALLRRRETAADAILTEFVRRRGVDAGQLEREVHLACGSRRDAGGQLHFVSNTGRKAMLSRQCIILIDEALGIARKRHAQQIDTDHALLALAGKGTGTGSLLQPHGITARTVNDVLGRAGPSGPAPVGEASAAAVSGRQSPATGAIYQREDLLRSLLTILNQAVNRHVVLTGLPGAGKRTLAASLGQLIARGEGPGGIGKYVRVAEDDLLDDDVKAIREGLARARGGVLFLPHLQRFFGGPGKAQFAASCALIQKTLRGNDPVIVATADDDAWNARLAGEMTIGEHCQVLRVPEPSISETLEILRQKRRGLEEDYQLQVSDDALKLAVSLARRYMAATPLPRSAERLLHRSAAMVNVSRQSRLSQPAQSEDRASLEADDVLRCAGEMTGVPVNQPGDDERQRYAGLTDYLKTRLKGQDQAVQAVSRAIRTARVGLKEPQRPAGSFLFLGPTGVGKTHLARTLAEFMFGTESAMLALDMSEFKDESSLNRLLGSPSGYVDSEAGGQLTERVRRQPWLLVLLDEVEKAHPRIMDLLLQVMDEGRLTDGRGRSASFSETVLILTSNLGSSMLATPVVTEEVRDAAMEQVRSWFRPELLNRLDDIIMFNALSAENLRDILDLLLVRECELAANRGLKLAFSENAVQWLQQQNSEPHYGARPLQRIIRRHVRVPLADYLLRADSPQGSSIDIDADSSGLTFATIAADGQKAPLQG